MLYENRKRRTSDWLVHGARYILEAWQKQAFSLSSKATEDSTNKERGTGVGMANRSSYRSS